MAQAPATDPAWLDRMYNNRALVPDHADYFARWAEQSKLARQTQDCRLDLRYGPSALEKLDLFLPARPSHASAQGAPVVVFIHGGYWRSLDKSDHSFLAPALVAAGACVVVPNYDLCPAVSIPEIALQMVKAVAWTYRDMAAWGGDPSRITLVGHSAGGHLAALLLACDWSGWAGDLPDDVVKNALSISGLYELDAIMHTPFLKDALRLTPADARRASPAYLPAPRKGQLYSVAGGHESAEFLRHNRLIQQAWGRQTVPVSEALAGLNHFSVLEALAKTGHRLNRLLLQLLKQTA